MSHSPAPASYLVIGGTGGIGGAVARRLKESGHAVLITGRDTLRLEQVAGALGVSAMPLDARDSAATEEATKRAAEQLGRLDGVVNCAGSVLLKPAHLTSDEEFAETLAQNLSTAFHVLRASARLMMRQEGGGSIVLCSSVAARRGLPNHEAIAAAKAGIEGLALAAAASYARQGVRVNCVAPGLTRTPLTRAFTQNEAALKLSSAMHPLGRIGEPEDVASAICWLLAREQGWVTGQVLAVDGGLSSIQTRN